MKSLKILVFSALSFLAASISFPSCTKSDELASIQNGRASLRAITDSIALDSMLVDSSSIDSVRGKHHHHGLCGDSLYVALKDSLGFGKHHRGFGIDSLKNGHSKTDSTVLKPFGHRPSKGSGFDSIPEVKNDSLKVHPPKGGGHGTHGGKGGRK